MLLLFPFRNEKQLLSGCPPFYQNKLQEQGVQDAVNKNKIKFEPYLDLIVKSRLLQDDEIAKRINSLNSKQREDFNVVHTWAKDYGHNVEPLHIFLSHLVKVIYNACITARTLRKREFVYLDLEEYQQ